MITDEQFNCLNEPCAGFQVREITDGDVSAFELKSISRPIKVGNSGSVKARPRAQLLPRPQGSGGLRGGPHQRYANAHT